MESGGLTMNESNENPFQTPLNEGQPPKPAQPSRLMRRVVFYAASLLIIGVIIGMLQPAVRQVREPARRAHCQNKLKHLALALLNYESAFGRLPPAYTVDENGNPLHSWRTLILPFIEERALYDSIDLTKPWDDPVNAHARNTTPDFYRCPSTDWQPGFTNYLANVGEQGALIAGTGRLLEDFIDGTEQTVLVFEVHSDQAVEWMSPHDGDYETFLKMIEGKKWPHAKSSNVVMSDGSTRSLTDPSQTKAGTYLPLFTIDAGDETEKLE